MGDNGIVLMLNEDKLQGEKSSLWYFLFFFLFLFSFKISQVTLSNWGKVYTDVVKLFLLSLF